MNEKISRNHCTKKQAKHSICLLLVFFSLFTFYSCIPEVINFPVPLHFQEQANWYGPACVKMWAAYDQVNPLPEQSHIAYYTVGPSGTTMQLLEWAVKTFTYHYGAFKAVFGISPYHQDQALASVLSSLLQGSPAIIPIEQGTHTVIAFRSRYTENSFNGRRVIQQIGFHDPFRGSFSHATIETAKYLFSLGPYLSNYEVIIGDGNYLLPALNGLEQFILEGGTYYGGPEPYVPIIY